MGSQATIDVIKIQGRHAEIIDEISSTNENEAQQPLFTRILDTYYIAGLIGLLSNREGKVDTSNKFTKTIFSDTVYRNISEINFIMAFPVIKNYPMDKVSNVKRAFFTESSDEENYAAFRKNYFEKYVLGGLEIIDEEVLHDQEGNKLKDANELELFYRLEELLNKLTSVNIVEDLPDLDLDDLILDEI